jgi:triphosphoribosyl-dephospho-CoA synthetase
VSAPSSPTPACERLATALEAGLRLELHLTPKPGLVDRRDQGSHPDLTFALMERSVALVGGYLAEVAGSLLRGEPLEGQVALGRAAEARMLSALGANTHRGAIFLGGLVLVARHRAPAGEAALPAAVSAAAEALLPGRALNGSHGATARRAFGVGGVVGEALAGLPSVFRAALPAFRAARARGQGDDAAAFAAMAALMQVVEDTTSLHRGGAPGLARVRCDGRELQRRLEAGEDHLAFLAGLNDLWRARRLTMGGVADLLGVTLGLLVDSGELGAG